MAVTPGAAEPPATAGGEPAAGAGSPPGAGRAKPVKTVVFRIDGSRSLFYRSARTILVALLGLWYRPTVQGRAQVPETGPVILAPVHRSNIDFAFSALLTRRKLFFMAKEELWRFGWFGRFLESLGVFPVHRSGTDRESVHRAEEVLRAGHPLVMFPEGSRHAGAEVAELAEGVAFVAARTGATIVPIGIGGSERSMPKGSRFPKPVKVRISVGQPIEVPRPEAGRRVPRSQVHRLTETLRERLQQAYDDTGR